MSDIEIVPTEAQIIEFSKELCESIKKTDPTSFDVDWEDCDEVTKLDLMRTAVYMLKKGWSKNGS